MPYIDRRVAIGLWRDLFLALYPRMIAIGTLPKLPAMLFHDAMDLLVVDVFLMSSSQYGSDSSRPILRKFLNHLAHLVHKPCFGCLQAFFCGFSV